MGVFLAFQRLRFPTYNTKDRDLIPGWEIKMTHVMWYGQKYIYTCKYTHTHSRRCCCSAAQLCPTPCSHGLQHARTPCPSPSPRACSNSYPLSQWDHPTISPLLYPSPVFNLSQHQGLFKSVRSSHQVAKGLEIQLQHQAIQWVFPLKLAGLILLSKGLTRVFSNTTVWKHQFFGVQLSLWSNSHIHRWLLENHSFDYTELCWQSNVSAF